MSKEYYLQLAGIARENAYTTEDIERWRVYSTLAECLATLALEATLRSLER